MSGYGNEEASFHLAGAASRRLLRPRPVAADFARIQLNSRSMSCTARIPTPHQDPSQAHLAACPAARHLRALWGWAGGDARGANPDLLVFACDQMVER